MTKNDPEYYRNWYLKNRDKVRATRRLYYLRNQEALKAKQRAYAREKRAAERKANATKLLTPVDGTGTESHPQVQGAVHTLSGTDGLSASRRPEEHHDGS